jgi:RHS repeat-associated protein
LTPTTCADALGAAPAVNGAFSYLGADELGSATVALDASGTLPGSFGYTGQRSDGATGLDYYVSRYYDPLAGVFTSADTTLPCNGYDVWALSRYAYVEGDPEARLDPTATAGRHAPCPLARWWARRWGRASRS